MTTLESLSPLVRARIQVKDAAQEQRDRQLEESQKGGGLFGGLFDKIAGFLAQPIADSLGIDASIIKGLMSAVLSSVAGAFDPRMLLQGLESGDIGMALMGLAKMAAPLAGPLGPMISLAAQAIYGLAKNGLNNPAAWAQLAGAFAGIEAGAAAGTLGAQGESVAQAAREAQNKILELARPYVSTAELALARKKGAQAGLMAAADWGQVAGLELRTSQTFTTALDIAVTLSQVAPGQESSSYLAAASAIFGQMPRQTPVDGFYQASPTDRWQKFVGDLV